MSSNTMETEDLAKFAVGGRALRSRRIRRALIARLINERANGSDEDADEGTTGDSGDEDHQLVRALVGSRVLQRRRFRRLLLAKLIRARGEAGDEGDEDYEDEDEGDEGGGTDDRQLVRLLVGSRMLRRRRVRRALLAKLIRERGAAGDEGDVEDDFEDDEEGGEEGGDRERQFLRLVMGSRILRRRRVRRALLAKLIRERGAAGGESDEYDEDEGDDDGPDLERQVSRLLVGGQMVKRRRARRALVHFLRNRNGDN